MRRRGYLRATGALSLAGVVGLAGCSGGGDDPTAVEDDATTSVESDASTTERDSTTTASPTPTEADHTVAMVTEGREYYFDPIGLFVEAGATVAWEIRSGTHSSTAYSRTNNGVSETRIPDGADAWDSTVLAGRGASHSHTFVTPGTYDYFCVPHDSLGMVGRIVVEEPGGPATGSMPPHGTVPASETIVERGTVGYRESRAARLDDSTPGITQYGPANLVRLNKE